MCNCILITFTLYSTYKPYTQEEGGRVGGRGEGRGGWEGGGRRGGREGERVYTIYIINIWKDI